MFVATQTTKISKKNDKLYKIWAFLGEGFRSLGKVEIAEDGKSSTEIWGL